VTTVTRLGIADGDLGIAQTCATMADIIRKSVAQPIVRQQVSQIISGISPSDWYGQAYAVRDWLSQHIAFMRDPAGVELLHTPEWLLRTIAANGQAQCDCDDISILSGALMGAIGWSVSLITVAFLDSGTYSHVYTVALAPSASFVDRQGEQVWIEFDTSRPMQELPLNLISRSKVYPVL